MPTLPTRVAALTLMLVTVLAQTPPQTTTDQVSTTSSATSAAPTASIASSTSSVATQTSASEVRVHVVKAGAGGFHFEPAELTNVSVGDIITFEFYPPDHSVARAEYGSACVPYEYTGGDKTGFWSETQWVDTPDDITYWNLTINSTEPIFYYCAAPDSCTGKQMVGVINPNNTQTLAEQVKAAVKADYQVAPGDPVPKEASSSSISTPTASLQSDLASAEEQSQTLSTGAIAGITVGGILFLVLCAGVLFYFTRNWPRPERHIGTEQVGPNIPSGLYQQSLMSPTSPMDQNSYGLSSYAPREQTQFGRPVFELPVDEKQR